MSLPQAGDTSNPQSPALTACWSCRGVIAPGDKFCRHCGRRQMRGDTWYFQAGWILFLALTVLGPFALPLVWRSPHLSRSQKWVVGGIITVYSAIVLWLFYWITKLIWNQFAGLDRDLRELHLP